MSSSARNPTPGTMTSLPCFKCYVRCQPMLLLSPYFQVKAHLLPCLFVDAKTHVLCVSSADLLTNKARQGTTNAVRKRRDRRQGDFKSKTVRKKTRAPCNQWEIVVQQRYPAKVPELAPRVLYSSRKHQ